MAKPARASEGPVCLNCGKRIGADAKRYKPFCSRRCADVDLHRWLGGLYRLPAGEDSDGADPAGEDGDALG